MRIYFGKFCLSLLLYLTCMFVSNTIFIHSNLWHRLSPSQQVSCSTTVESSSLSLSQSNLTACGSSNNQEMPISKWNCSMCTYVNSIKCSRCAQCAMKRDAETDSSSNVQEQINALSIKDVDPELIAVNNRTSPLRSSSLSNSRTNLGAAGNRISPVDNKCYSTNKWPCSVCNDND